MNINFHLGAHSPVSSALDIFFEENFSALGDLGVNCPPRTSIQDNLMPVLNEEYAITPYEQTRISSWLNYVEDFYECTTLCFSFDTFLSGKRGVLRGGVLYKNLENKLLRTSQLLSEHNVSIHLSIEDTGTFIPNIVEVAPEHLLEQIRAMPVSNLSWVPVVERVKKSIPHAQLFVWPSDDFAQIAETVLERLCGVDSISTKFDLTKAIQAFEQSRSKIGEGLKILNWTEDRFDKLELRFLDDLEEIAAMDGLSLIECYGGNDAAHQF